MTITASNQTASRFPGISSDRFENPLRQSTSWLYPDIDLWQVTSATVRTGRPFYGVKTGGEGQTATTLANSVIPYDPAESAPTWMAYVSDRLSTMATRSDGLDLPRVQEDVIANAYQVADLFPRNVPAPQVGTTIDGGVQFAWHRGGWDIEIEIPPSGESLVWGLARDSSYSFEGPLTQHSTKLYGLLTAFVVAS
jgi:hypothetical protein